MLRTSLWKIRQCLIVVWHSLRKPPVEKVVEKIRPCSRTPGQARAATLREKPAAQEGEGVIMPLLLTSCLGSGRWGKRTTLPDEDTVKIRVWIGASRIAGNGLFAAQDIKKDTRIIRALRHHLGRV